jgi:ATP-dependent Clp protease protease subunit
MIIPTVIDSDGRTDRAYDIYSRLLEDRIVYLGEDVNHHTANLIIAQLLFLESKDPNKDITLYINSPGGSVYDGLAIYDTMQFLKCDVSTVGIGMQASMGAFLMSSGAKGKRYLLPNATVMIHQPSSGTRGKVTDMEIDLKEGLRLKHKLNEILAKNTGQKVDKVASDAERDYWMTAEEAVKYGIADKVIDKR